MISHFILNANALFAVFYKYPKTYASYKIAPEPTFPDDSEPLRISNEMLSVGSSFWDFAQKHFRRAGRAPEGPRRFFGNLSNFSVDHRS